MTEKTYDAKRIQDVYGLSLSSVESGIIIQFELVAHRRGLHIEQNEAKKIGEFAAIIVSHVLAEGGSGRVEPSGRKYSSRERDRNFQSAQSLARKLAIRCLERASDGHAQVVEPFYIGDQRIRFRSTPGLFESLCPPPFPPFC